MPKDKKRLLDSSSEEEEEEEEKEVGPLKINESYANVYNKYREKEVFQKLKDKYGEEAANKKLDQDLDDDSSSESETEDEDAEELTEEVERDFFKTLASLKKKDKSVYDGQTTFFTSPVKEDKPKEKKGDKPMYLGDFERKIMVEKGGHYEELDNEKELLQSKVQTKTYVQEMSDITDSLRKATKNDGDESDEDEDLLLVKRTKTKVEHEKEDEDYRLWLAGQKESIKDENVQKELKGLRDYWADEKLDEGEKFLKDFILNKRYLDRNVAADDYTPTYDEIVHDSDQDLSEDEKTLAKQEEFEHKFNFRFEEPDQEFIKRYPRTIEESMRRKDESRKKKREEVKDRKEQEKEVKREELKQLKALKRKEIMSKLDKLKKITGNDQLAFKDEDLEEDFDPDAYDKRMADVFAQYDHVGPEDDVKPEFSDLGSDIEQELEVENWDAWEGNEEEEVEEQEKTTTKMDTQRELIEASKGRKKSKKKKSKFAESLEVAKPLFNPENNKSLEAYIDEYYQLDYEDIVADIPCRFKYRKVEPNSFGLSAQEILTAPDRELNAWCSLKKTCQYRSEEEEKQDVMEYSKKGKNVNLKRNVLPSLFSEVPEEKLKMEQAKKATKSQKRRQRRQKNKFNTEEPPAKKVKTEEEEGKSKRKRRNRKAKQGPAINTDVLNNLSSPNKNKKNKNINAQLALSDTRLEHYGLNPNQFKRKVRKQKYNKTDT